jgi:hypothetical protein
MINSLHNKIMLVACTSSCPWFIEPNAFARRMASKFSYPSHRLRFAMKRPPEAFRARINAAAETSETVSSVSGSDSNWLFAYRQYH